MDPRHILLQSKSDRSNAASIFTLGRIGWEGAVC